MFLKRAFDIAVSATGMVLLSPIFAVTATASYVQFRKNPIHAVERVGIGGQVFDMYKFRSMTDAIDNDGELLCDELRTPKLGAFLRRTAIDELPQLYNVLKGDMSIVGPRPVTENEMMNLVPTDYARDMQSVRPGLTGPWQVSAIGKEQMPNLHKYALNAAYAKSGPNVLKDIRIMFDTLPAFYKGHDGEGVKSPLPPTRT